MAEVLKTLGSEHVLVVSGTDGLDEISLCAPTRVAELRDGEIKEFVLNPADLGLSLASNEELKGGDVADNASILRAVFAGSKGPKRDIVALNAAAALYVGGLAPTLKDGLAKAQSVLDSGLAAQTLAKWVKLSQSLAPTPA
jgi:anthranilate phosphoribosyltransferase